MMIMSKGRISKSVTNNSYEGQTELRRGTWTLDEDNLLVQYIASHGDGRWNFLAKSAGLKRTGKSCRLRWLNYLKPGIRRGNLTPQEQLLILELHSKLGNRWSEIAQHLPGRTDNEIKNYWRTKVQKQARQLKVDSNSKKFLQAIRQFWIPRLKESMEQNSSLASISSSPCSSSISAMETQKTNSPSPVVTNDVPLHSPCPNPSQTGADSLVKLMSPEYLTFACGNSFEGDCYDDGRSILGYGMQELNALNISASGCHVINFDWFGEDFGESFWCNYDLWQFKNIA